MAVHNGSGGHVAKLERQIALLERLLDAASILTPHRDTLGESDPQRIGVLLQWGIGDAVLALPLLVGLKKAFPQASIDTIGKPWLTDLFSGEPWLGSTHNFVPPWATLNGKFNARMEDWWRFVREIRRLRKTSFDLLIGTRLDPRESAQLRLLRARRTAHIPNAGGRRWIDIGLDVTSDQFFRRKYRAEISSEMLRAVTGLEISAIPRFQRSDLGVENACAVLRGNGYRGGPIIAVHGGAGNPIRRWNPSNFNDVLERCHDQAAFVVLIDDAFSPDAGKLRAPNGVRSMRWKSNLADLRGLLSISSALLCCDSGVMHIAAACGLPVIAVFGPTSVEVFSPPGQEHQVIAEPMPCRPCADHCMYSSPLCMERVSVEAVTNAVKRALLNSVPSKPE